MSLASHVNKAIKTICEMMHDRGENEVQDALQKYIGDEVVTLVSGKSIFCIDVGDTCRVLFALANKFKGADVKKYIDEDIATQFKFILVVVREKISSINQKVFDEFENVQVFELKDLMINISKHVLVPKHEVIRDEAEIQRILELHDAKTKSVLPSILKNDAMAKYLYAKPGNIIRITRNSPTAGEHYVYRTVV